MRAPPPTGRFQVVIVRPGHEAEVDPWGRRGGGAVRGKRFDRNSSKINVARWSVPNCVARLQEEHARETPRSTQPAFEPPMIKKRTLRLGFAQSPPIRLEGPDSPIDAKHRTGPY